MKFNLEEIDEKQLELLGIDEDALRSLPKRTIDSLLNGGRTSMIRFPKLNIPGLEGRSLDAKLSLERNADGSVGLRFHPINKIPKNAFQLSEPEIKSIKSGETNFVEKEIAGKPHLVCIDNDTNEFIAVNKSSIVAPEAINGFYLTPQQKQDFVEGKDITINGMSVRLQSADELQVENKNNPGEVFDSIQFKHSTYTKQDLLLDLMLCSVGLGHIVMLGHLLNLMIHTGSYHYKNLRQSEKRRLQNAVADTQPSEAKLKRGEFITPKEFKQIIEAHLGKPVETGIINEENLVLKPGEAAGVDVTVKDDTATVEHETEKIQESQDRNDYPGKPEITPENIEDFLPVEKVKIKY